MYFFDSDLSAIHFVPMLVFIVIFFPFFFSCLPLIFPLIGILPPLYFPSPQITCSPHVHFSLSSFVPSHNYSLLFLEYLHTPKIEWARKGNSSLSLSLSLTRVQPVHCSLLCLPLTIFDGRIKSYSAFIFMFVRHVSMFLSLFIFLFISINPSIFLSMPLVGVHHRRWEVIAWVCAGNHGNHVLIGQWPGRMIGSCCQRGLFMQTSSGVGRPQMGPKDSRRRKKDNLFSLFPVWANQSNSWGLETLDGMAKQCAAGYLCLKCVLLCWWLFTVLASPEEQQH